MELAVVDAPISADLGLKEELSSRIPFEGRGKVVTRKKRTFCRTRLEADFLRYCQLSTESPEAPLNRSEFEALCEEADNHIPNDDFSKRTADTAILGDDLLSLCVSGVPRASSRKVSLPPHLAGLCEEKLLTPEQERKLFQRMNYLRHTAAKILSKHDANSIGQWDIERVQGLLRAANWHRDVIVRANVRLVISIVKKFVNPQCGFDDLLSDGIMALIRSVDKFDYELGFRFSTYATQVVRRNSYRYVMERQDERLKVTNSIGEAGLDVADETGNSSMSEHRWHALRTQLAGMLDQLDKREKLIIRARFSLGGHRRVQTLQSLADRLGISKERVRQLEKRAMEKLQQLAIANPPQFAAVD